ncbi:MAG: hypothetical protein L3K14_06395 [Thermoplasmata archaeon]|nr:hypothetical protein [Thermoplasmata archaeon]
MLFASTSGGSAAGVTPSNSSPHSCDQSQTTNETIKISSGLDLGLERKTAAQSPLFVSASHNYSLNVESHTDTWSTTPDCGVELASAGLVFSATNAMGMKYGELRIIENPNLASVVDASWIQNDTAASMCGSSAQACWSGYDFHDPGVSYAQDQMQWDIPVANPSSGCGNGCTEKVAVWVGQTVQLGGGSGSTAGIAQTGTLSSVSVNWYGTTRTYSLWYEYWPGSLVTCFTGAYTPGAGDNMKATAQVVYNRGVWEYYLSLVDYSIGSGYTCTAYSGMAMGVPPNYYEFMVENPEDTQTGTPWQGPNTGWITLNNLIVNNLGAENFTNYKWTQMPNDQVGSLSYSGFLLHDFFQEHDTGCAC